MVLTKIKLASILPDTVFWSWTCLLDLGDWIANVSPEHVVWVLYSHYRHRGDQMKETRCLFKAFSSPGSGGDLWLFWKNMCCISLIWNDITCSYFWFESNTVIISGEFWWIHLELDFYYWSVSSICFFGFWTVQISYIISMSTSSTLIKIFNKNNHGHWLLDMGYQALHWST